MRFTTKLEDYHGKAILKIPQKLSEIMGLKVGDPYTIRLTPEKYVFIQFPRKKKPIHQAPHN